MEVRTSSGYSVWMAAIVFASFLVGMGLVAMPQALARLGWWGMLLIALVAANVAYCSAILGKSWTMLEEMCEEYKGKFRYPYPAIGEQAVGPWMRYGVRIPLHISFLGTAVVYLLLAAQITQIWTAGLITLEYKYWILILAAILCPLNWFGSIGEFLWAAVGALGSVTLASLAILVGIMLAMADVEEAPHGGVTLTSTSLAFGTATFGLSGAHLFPTIQNDMADRRQYLKATLLGFLVLMLLYIPVTVTGYAIFGSNVSSNIVECMEDGSLKTFTMACLAVHISLAYLIVSNPVSQEIEEALNVRQAFNLKRCLIRTTLVAVTAGVAIAVPQFDKILNFIGGSTIALVTYVYPPLFYYRITQKYNVNEKTAARSISLLEKAFLSQVVIMGVIGGILCTYFGFIDIIKT